MMGPSSSRTAREILTHPSLLRFALAHHPTCDRFAPDVVVIQTRSLKFPLCTGCTVFWPLLLIGLPLVLALAVHFHLPWWALATPGLLLGTVQLSSYMNLTRTRRRKVAVKSAFGAGVVAVVAALLLAPWPPVVRLGVGVVLMALAAVVHTRRLKNITTVCDGCPWQRDWQRCPGFAPLNDHVPGDPPAGDTENGQRLPRAWPWPR